MVPLNSAYRVYINLRDLISEDIEEFWVMALDPGKHLIANRMVSRGTVDHCLVHPRDVFRFACQANASSLLIAHNHPSQDMSPSPQDILLTERLVKASQLIEIPIVDHILLSPLDFRSFKGEGWVSFPNV